MDKSIAQKRTGRPYAGNVQAQTRIPAELKDHIVQSGQKVSDFLKMVAMAYYKSEAVRNVVDGYYHK